MVNYFKYTFTTVSREDHFDKNDKVAHLIGHYVTDVARGMLRTLHNNFRKNGFNVTPEQWIVLVWLFEKDGRTQQELCDLTFKEKPSITRILTNLEANGLVTRMDHPTDGRSKVVFLTKDCKKMEKQLLAIAGKTQETIVAGIPEAEIEACKTVLRKIMANLG